MSSSPGADDDGRVVWLTRPDGEGLPPRPASASRRLSTFTVLGIALVSVLAVAGSLYDESRRWEAQATAATRERDEVREQLARAETRIAQLEDVLDRTERARWETGIQRAEASESVGEAMDSCVRAVEAAAASLARDGIDSRDVGGSVQEADEACHRAASAHDVLSESPE